MDYQKGSLHRIAELIKPIVSIQYPGSIPVVIVINEGTEEEYKSLVQLPIVLYQVKASPFYKSTFSSISLLAEYVSGMENKSPSLDIHTILEADRIVITEYTSPSGMEERIMKEEPDNTAIAIIVETILQLFEEYGVMDVHHLTKLLLLYPHEEGSSCVFSPFASYIAQRDLFDSFQIATLSDALSSM